MKFKRTTTYLTISICAGLYFTIAEVGKLNGSPLTQSVLYLGFWMLGAAYEAADTVHQIENSSKEQP